MNLRKCYEKKNQTYEKFTKNAFFQKKILRKTYAKVTKKTYDSLLADLGQHRTRMQKFVRKTYEIVTCWLRAKM